MKIGREREEERERSDGEFWAEKEVCHFPQALPLRPTNFRSTCYFESTLY